VELIHHRHETLLLHGHGVIARFEVEENFGVVAGRLVADATFVAENAEVGHLARHAVLRANELTDH
jgi:hypothetical protein